MCEFSRLLPLSESITQHYFGKKLIAIKPPIKSIPGLVFCINIVQWIYFETCSYRLGQLDFSSWKNKSELELVKLTFEHENLQITELLYADGSL